MSDPSNDVERTFDAAAEAIAGCRLCDGKGWSYTRYRPLRPDGRRYALRCDHVVHAGE